MAERITWADLDRRLSNNDVIARTEAPGHDSNAIEFVLKTASAVTWWKGLKLYAGDGKLLGQVGIENGRYDDPAGTDRIRFPVDAALLSGARLEFCKAKMFGVHTGMYCIDDLLSKRGIVVTLEWRGD
jgi:hypothetical protein